MFEKPTELDIKKEIETFEVDEQGYVEFGFVSRRFCGQQSQYASRYVDAFGGHPKFKDEYPSLGEGLRILGNSDDYHSMKIHKDDIEEFVRKYNEYLKKEREL